MKKMFVLSMLISFAMICSCQKQNSAAEQQLAQRKAELDAREKALDERELAEKQRAATMARTILPRTISPDLQSRLQSPSQGGSPAQAKIDPAQVRAERDRRLQQVSPDIKAIMPNPSEMNPVRRDARMQERLAERQRRLEEIQSMRASAGLPALQTPASLAPSPAAAASTPPSLAASPAAEATSPSPSPTPQ
jgi:hypothetical protein